MDFSWNCLQVEFTEDVYCIYTPAEVPSVEKVRDCLECMAKVFDDESFRSETNLYNRLCYILSCPFRSNKLWAGMQMANKCLKRIPELGLDYLAGRLSLCLSNKRISQCTIRLPPLETFVCVLVKLQGLSQLLVQTVYYLRDAFYCGLQLIHLGQQEQKVFVLMTNISRLWVIVRSLILYCIEWYQTLKPFSLQLKPLRCAEDSPVYSDCTRLKELASELPEDLAEWLGPGKLSVLEESPSPIENQDVQGMDIDGAAQPTVTEECGRKSGTEENVGDLASLLEIKEMEQLKAFFMRESRLLKFAKPCLCSSLTNDQWDVLESFVSSKFHWNLSSEPRLLHVICEYIKSPEKFRNQSLDDVLTNQVSLSDGSIEVPEIEEHVVNESISLQSDILPPDDGEIMTATSLPSRLKTVDPEGGKAVTIDRPEDIDSSEQPTVNETCELPTEECAISQTEGNTGDFASLLKIKRMEQLKQFFSKESLLFRLAKPWCLCRSLTEDQWNVLESFVSSKYDLKLSSVPTLPRVIYEYIRWPEKFLNQSLDDVLITDMALRKFSKKVTKNREQKSKSVQSLCEDLPLVNGITKTHTSLTSRIETVNGKYGNDVTIDTAERVDDSEEPLTVKAISESSDDNCEPIAAVENEKKFAPLLEMKEMQELKTFFMRESRLFKFAKPCLCSSLTNDQWDVLESFVSSKFHWNFPRLLHVICEYIKSPEKFRNQSLDDVLTNQVSLSDGSVEVPENEEHVVNESLSSRCVYLPPVKRVKMKRKPHIKIVQRTKKKCVSRTASSVKAVEVSKALIPRYNLRPRYNLN